MHIKRKLGTPGIHYMEISPFHLGFPRGSRGGLASFWGFLTFFHGGPISCHGDFDTSRKGCPASFRVESTSVRGIALPSEDTILPSGGTALLSGGTALP